VEISHWLHGTSVPNYATYLSGAPVIYPPLSAAAASIGGLAATRLMSMAFMLGATALLWGVTSRLFGRWAAFAAAALFAVLGPTQFLGAFATYDAMALFLMAAATWCVVAAQDRADSTLLLLAGAALLALANATKYASALFDPTVVALGGLAVARSRGIKAGIGRAGLVAAWTGALLSAMLSVGGSSYLTGVLSTTLTRAAGTSPAMTVLSDAAKWIGIVCAIAVIGVAIGNIWRVDRVQLAIVTVLAVSGFLAPLNQARIHTTTSLSKHVDFGAWFAAAAAGYLVARLAASSRRWWIGAGASGLAVAAVLAFAGKTGSAQAADFYQVWPNSSQVTSELRALTRTHSGHYLTEDYDVPAYYLENRVAWWQWSNTWFFTYRPGGSAKTLSGPAAFQAAIDQHYFSLIILDFGDTAHVDSQIAAYIRQAGTYHVIAELPYWDKFGVGQFTVWAYQRSSRG
jgi:4-amino-4-deoxy-L-arabinose transferase-like glycosyltransferase